MNNVRLVGAGTQATSLTSATTTGNLFDFTGASFCTVEDLSLVSTAERTAGAVFYLDHGAGTCQRNEFRRLRIHGGWRIWHLDDCTTTSIDEIQVADFNATHDWDSMISLAGATTSTIVSNVRGGTEATVTNGFIYISGASVDTAHFHNFDILNLGASTGMISVNVSAGVWMKFTDCSFESGTTADCFVVNAGVGIDITACHLLGRRGLLINAGTCVRMIGGEVVGCDQHGILIAGGTHHEISGVSISDVSRLTTATYDGINVSGGVTDFTLVDNHFGKMMLSGANSMLFAIDIVGGAGNRYVIRGNRVATTGVALPMNDGGTGTDKVVKDNVWTDSGYGTVASATTITLPVNAETVTVTGTTTITSVTASYKGRRVTLVFSGTLTFTDGSNLILAGNFVTSGDDTITLVCNGTNWYETGRSVN